MLDRVQTLIDFPAKQLVVPLFDPAADTGTALAKTSVIVSTIGSE